MCVCGWFSSDSPAAERSGAHSVADAQSQLPGLSCTPRFVRLRISGRGTQNHEGTPLLSNFPRSFISLSHICAAGVRGCRWVTQTPNFNKLSACSLPRALMSLYNVFNANSEFWSWRGPGESFLSGAVRVALRRAARCNRWLRAGWDASQLCCPCSLKRTHRAPQKTFPLAVRPFTAEDHRF